MYCRIRRKNSKWKQVVYEAVKTFTLRVDLSDGRKLNVCITCAAICDSKFFEDYSCYVNYFDNCTSQDRLYHR